MAELADARDLKSRAVRREGSIPSPGTIRRAQVSLGLPFDKLRVLSEGEGLMAGHISSADSWQLVARTNKADLKALLLASHRSSANSC